MALDTEDLFRASVFERRVALNSWQSDESGNYYYKKMRKLVGWQEVDGFWHHFDETGLMSAGWLDDKEERYYLSPEDGGRVEGWQKIDDKDYYFDPEKGSLITSQWLTQDDRRYYMTADGNPAKNLHSVDGTEYYFDEITGEYLLDASKPVLALTFDDGPVENTSKLLDVLDKNSIKATFFLQGKNIHGNEEVLKRMNKGGHTIANHSYNHPDFTELSEEDIRWQIEETDRLIFDATGRKTFFFRSPYGSTNERVESLLAKPTILWNVDSGDWSGSSVDEICDMLLDTAEDGTIVLMHDTYSSTVSAIDKVVPLLKKRDFQFVNMDMLFKVKRQTPELDGVYYHLN
ncbi:MAG: polysaccharide deacetylase family protein [Tissierellia bacterium]|nr:polysaccharide deacetylase family protein [Tissierellia bacterium]